MSRRARPLHQRIGVDKQAATQHGSLEERAHALPKRQRDNMEERIAVHGKRRQRRNRHPFLVDTVSQIAERRSKQSADAEHAGDEAHRLDENSSRVRRNVG